MMRNNLKSILFAAIMCVVCSLLLTAASTGLKPLQQRNIVLDRQKNILIAFGIITQDQKIKNDDIGALYKTSIKHRMVNSSGSLLADSSRETNALPLYIHIKNGTVRAYVVPIDTRGLWGKIHGYLAIDNDGATIKGFTVYKHSETPGLGGQIQSRWFRKNFEGKKITDQDGNFVSISIAKGKTGQVVPAGKQPNYVDGISGATLTGKYLTAGFKTILEDYEPMAIEFRQKNQLYLRGN
ncbi:MAG: FMN-binding protein [Desulfobacteraceae bacterium]|nr:FMN-binding protein [Desulfobacteraceae bacterium]